LEKYFIIFKSEYQIFYVSSSSNFKYDEIDVRQYIQEEKT